MKNRLLQLILHITYITGLIFFVILFYFEVKNIFLTFYIIIISIVLFIEKLLYWYSIKSYKINVQDAYLLKLTVCIFIYFAPVYCIVQEPFLVVNKYISLVTLSIITLLAIVGIYIEKYMYIKESEKRTYEKKL